MSPNILYILFQNKKSIWKFRRNQTPENSILRNGSFSGLNWTPGNFQIFFCSKNAEKIDRNKDEKIKQLPVRVLDTFCTGRLVSFPFLFLLLVSLRWLWVSPWSAQYYNAWRPSWQCLVTVRWVGNLTRQCSTWQCLSEEGWLGRLLLLLLLRRWFLLLLLAVPCRGWACRVLLPGQKQLGHNLGLFLFLIIIVTIPLLPAFWPLGLFLFLINIIINKYHHLLPAFWPLGLFLLFLNFWFSPTFRPRVLAAFWEGGDN